MSFTIELSHKLTMACSGYEKQFKKIDEFALTK